MDRELEYNQITFGRGSKEAKHNPVILHCKYCGSENVTRDGVAGWNVKLQHWVLTGLYNSTDCQDCGRGNCIEERPIGK